MTEIELVEEQDRISWQAQMLIGGAIVGAIVGVGTSYLMARNSDENRGGPPEIKTMEILKIAVSVFGLVRVIAALGDD
jgi:hypothetical protein